MNERRYREDISVNAICGAVFTLVGTVLMICSAVFLVNYEEFKSGINGDARIFFAIFVGIGILTLGIGIIMLTCYLNQRKLRRNVFENGYAIRVPITDIRMDTRVRINGRYTYVVEAQYMEPVTKEIYLYRSRHFIHNPAKSLIDDSVPVYVIPPDYRNYYMDIDSIIR